MINRGLTSFGRYKFFLMHILPRISMVLNDKSLKTFPHLLMGTFFKDCEIQNINEQENNLTPAGR